MKRLKKKNRGESYSFEITNQGYGTKFTLTAQSSNPTLVQDFNLSVVNSNVAPITFTLYNETYNLLPTESTSINLLSDTINNLESSITTISNELQRNENVNTYSFSNNNGIYATLISNSYDWSETQSIYLTLQNNSGQNGKTRDESGVINGGNWIYFDESNFVELISNNSITGLVSIIYAMSITLIGYYYSTELQDGVSLTATASSEDRTVEQNISFELLYLDYEGYEHTYVNISASAFGIDVNLLPGASESLVYYTTIEDFENNIVSSLSINRFDSNVTTLNSRNGISLSTYTISSDTSISQDILLAFYNSNQVETRVQWDGLNVTLDVGSNYIIYNGKISITEISNLWDNATVEAASYVNTGFFDGTDAYSEEQIMSAMEYTITADSVDTSIEQNITMNINLADTNYAAVMIANEGGQTFILKGQSAQFTQRMTLTEFLEDYVSNFDFVLISEEHPMDLITVNTNTIDNVEMKAIYFTDEVVGEDESKYVDIDIFNNNATGSANVNYIGTDIEIDVTVGAGEYATEPLVFEYTDISNITDCLNNFTVTVEGQPWSYTDIISENLQTTVVANADSDDFDTEQDITYYYTTSNAVGFEFNSNMVYLFSNTNWETTPLTYTGTITNFISFIEDAKNTVTDMSSYVGTDSISIGVSSSDPTTQELYSDLTTTIKYMTDTNDDGYAVAIGLTISNDNSKSLELSNVVPLSNVFIEGLPIILDANSGSSPNIYDNRTIKVADNTTISEIATALEGATIDYAQYFRTEVLEDSGTPAVTLEIMGWNKDTSANQWLTYTFTADQGVTVDVTLTEWGSSNTHHIPAGETYSSGFEGTINDLSTWISGISVSIVQSHSVNADFGGNSDLPCTYSYYGNDTSNPTQISLEITNNDRSHAYIVDDVTFGLVLLNPCQTYTSSYDSFSVNDFANEIASVSIDTLGTIDGIAISSQPTTTTYTEGDALDITGLGIYAYYTINPDYSASYVGYESNIPLGECMLNPQDGDTLTTSDTEITIAYEDGTNTFTTTQSITVNAASVTLESIAVTQQPNKTTYIQGEVLDLSGMIVTGYFSDNTSRELDSNTEYTTSPADTSELNTAGQVTVTIVESISGDDKEAYTDVDVIATSEVSSIRIAEEPKNSYEEGETFDPAGMVMDVTYGQDSTGIDVLYDDNPQMFTFSPDETTPLQTTDTQVTITCAGQTTTLSITVAEAYTSSPE